MKRVLTLVMALVLLLTAASFASAEEETIVIGSLQDISGGAMQAGLAMMQGAELAADEINANGGIVAPWFMNRMMAVVEAHPTAETITNAQMGALLSGFAYAFVLLAATLAGLVLLIVRWKRREFYLAPEQLPRGATRRAAFGNPGVITCIVVGTLGTLLMLFA